MQLLLGAGEISGSEFGPGQQAAGQRVLDVRQFFLARRMQHEIDDFLREAERARMADAEAQAPEVRRAKAGLDVLEAVVAAVAAALLEADAAGRQVEVVVDDENLAGVESCRNWPARPPTARNGS